MISTAIQAAKEAGAFIMKHYGSLPEESIRKKGANDFLSFVDENSEKLIVDILHTSFPDHDILAEETGETSKESAYRWIIDPLDGTTNYLRCVPMFSISIALEYKGDIILGVIYDPVRDELFHAEKDKGAFCNEQRLSVSKKTSLSESFLATGFPFKAKQFLRDYLDCFELLFNHTIGMRRLGSAALDLAYVAAGRFDAYWELGLSPWDVAAGTVLVREAGGCITDFWNKPDFMNNSYILASNGKIHEELFKKINHVFPYYKPVT